MNLLLLMFPLLIVILMFWGADFLFFKKSESGSAVFTKRDDFFNQSKLIKGSACLAIILHHLVQNISQYGYIDKGPVNVFNNLGYVFTAIFFFFSGFGLILNLYSKPDYLKNFLIKRLPAVLVPFFIINLLNILLNRFVYGIKEGVIDLLKDFTGILLIDGNGWFIIEITLIYLMFYIIFKLIKNKDAALILLSMAVLLIIPFSFVQGHNPDGGKSYWFRGEWWYASTATFIFGMLFARFRDNCERFFKKHYRRFLPFSVILWLVLHFAAGWCLRFLGYYKGNMPGATQGAVITLVAQNLDSIAFSLTVLLLTMKITLGNRVLKAISSVSLELFLIHGCILDLIFFKIDTNDFAHFFIVYAVSLAATALIAPITHLAVKKVIAFLFYITDSSRNRKKVLLALLSSLLIFFAVIGAFLYGERIFFAKEIFEEEMKTLKNARAGDEIMFGRYDINPLTPGAERMTWIVVDRKGGVATLLAKEGIDGSYYNQKHEEVSWETSDLHNRINSGDYVKMFNKYESKRVEEVNGDQFTLLSVDEARTLFKTDKDRELMITSVAKNRGTNINQLSKVHSWDMKKYHTSWWWLRGDEGVSSLTAPIVNENGTIETDKKYVNKPSGAIRPVIYVRYGI